jgi:hypothetical protein
MNKDYVFNDRPALFDSEGNEINIETDKEKGIKVCRMSICVFTEDKGTDLASYSKYYQVFDGKYYCGLCNNENKEEIKSGSASGGSEGISNFMDHFRRRHPEFLHETHLKKLMQDGQKIGRTTTKSLSIYSVLLLKYYPLQHNLLLVNEDLVK